MRSRKQSRPGEASAGVFRALAHPSRRHILLALKFRGGKMTAGEIAERFSCRWPTTTRHLRVLEAAGLVRIEKRGRERLYCLEAKRLRAVVGEWLGWFDAKQPRQRMRARRVTR